MPLNTIPVTRGPKVAAAERNEHVDRRPMAVLACATRHAHRPIGQREMEVGNGDDDTTASHRHAVLRRHDRERTRAR
jgi:hypothetical protein